jgi:hypothetical protein
VFSFPSLTRFTNQVWRYRNKVDARMLRQIFMIPKFLRGGKVRKGLDEPTRRRLERHVQDAFKSKHLGRMYSLYALHYSLHSDCKKDPAKARCWADKANDVYGLTDIPRYMPKAKFIFIIRDPRAGIASMQGQTVKARAEEGSLAARHAALVDSAFYWRNMMQTLLRFAHRYPERTLFIRYEDFVLDPVAAMNRLHEFAVGARMDQEALAAGLAQFKFRRKHDKTSTGDGIDRKPLERWRTMLTPAEADLVSALTWRTGRKLGYDVEPPKGLAVAPRAIASLKSMKHRARSLAKHLYLAAVEPFTAKASADRVG